MSKRDLPERPDLNQLKRQAKELLRASREADSSATERVQQSYPGFHQKLTLAKAQAVVAREYGFPSWTALKVQVQAISGTPTDQALVDKLILAASNGGATEVISIIEAHPHIIDERGGDGTRTALHFAAWKRQADIVSILLDHLADPDVRCHGDNATPLHFASEQGDMAIVRMLLDHGADPHGFGDEHGLDIIGWATCFKQTHPEVAHLLMEYGARHNIFSAVALGEVEAIKRLVGAYADALDKPMASYEQRRQPVHLAVFKQQPASLETLIDLGANIEATDVRGFTALDLAAISQHSSLVEILLKKGADIRLPAALALGRAQRIDELMRQDPAALKPGGAWSNLLDAFCENGASGETVETLIRAGAPVDSLITSKSFGTKAYTPLHTAAFYNNLAAARVLLKHGASTSVRDETYHGTPLNWAHHAQSLEVAKLLESIGAPS